MNKDQPQVSTRLETDVPYFSVCIPEYNRADFLLEALRSLEKQTFRDFEICISDDCSPEARHQEFSQFLSQSGITFTIIRQQKNLRYDGNMRASITLARGQYCFLLGNDDVLASPNILEQIHDAIERHQHPGAIITNYSEISSGKLYRRMAQTGILGTGAGLAATTFRDYAFVSGVVLRRDLCHEFATDRFDGTEMYQMYLGARIVSAGHALLGLDLVAIQKDIQIPGLSVDSYAKRPPAASGWPKARKLPLARMGALVAQAIEPSVSRRQLDHYTWIIFKQFILFTYAFWLIEYRRVQSWKYSFEVCLGMSPRYQLEGLNVSIWNRSRIQALYILVTVAGLVIPVWLFARLRWLFYKIAKRKQSSL